MCKEGEGSTIGNVQRTNLAEKTYMYMYTTLFFFPNGRFGNGKDRGWWGDSAIGLRVGLD